MKSFLKPTQIGPAIPIAMMAAALLLLPSTAPAFPPAPSHLIYGTVRDEYGTPLMTSQAQIILETPTGVQLTTSVAPGIGYDMNFELEVPMDAGLTPDPYEPKALMASAPFKIYVVIGVTTNLPIQMTGNYSQLGQPGQQTRIDLTLGVDSNGDGIPDAWELAFLASIGSNLSLSNLTSGLRLTSDGRTLQQQFLAGNYPFDPGELFILTVVAPNNGAPVLQFTAMTGRFYTLLGSADLKTWTPLNFSFPSDGPNGAAYGYYFSPGIQTLQIQTIQPSTGPTMRYFKMMLQ
ncbi:MAG TPA: hypothetical protein VH598_11025 [Verrucomicrobiae bacterium]|nr:hypothetical protein [Verrucomicrobiae bacterium]